jgi:hypothetical protein
MSTNTPNGRDACVIGVDKSDVVDLGLSLQVGMPELPLFPGLKVTPFHTIEKERVQLANLSWSHGERTARRPVMGLKARLPSSQVPSSWLIGPPVM